MVVLEALISLSIKGICSFLNFTLEMNYFYDLCPKFEIFTIMSSVNP